MRGQNPKGHGDVFFSLSALKQSDSACVWITSFRAFQRGTSTSTVPRAGCMLKSNTDPFDALTEAATGYEEGPHDIN